MENKIKSRAQGYQRFPLSKPRVGQNIALHAENAGRTSTFLVKFCLPDSFNFIFVLTLFIRSSVRCVLCSAYAFFLMVDVLP